MTYRGFIRRSKQQPARFNNMRDELIHCQFTLVCWSMQPYTNNADRSILSINSMDIAFAHTQLIHELAGNFTIYARFLRRMKRMQLPSGYEVVVDMHNLSPPDSRIQQE